MPKGDKKMSEKERVIRILGDTAHFNGGVGLIVPEIVGKKLIEMGIKDNYVVSKMLKTTST